MDCLKYYRARANAFISFFLMQCLTVIFVCVCVRAICVQGNPAHTPAPVTSAAHAAACGTDAPSSSSSQAEQGACAAVPGVEVGAAGVPTRPGPLHRPASSLSGHHGNASSAESAYTAPPGHGHRVHMAPLSGADAIIDYYRATTPKAPAAEGDDEGKARD